MIRRLALFVLFASLLGFGASFVVESSYAGRAKLIQRIKPHDKAMAELLGEAGEPIGSPQEIIVDDPAAFIPAPEGYEGPAMVNDAYLQEKGIYPLQLKTVRYVAGLARWGFLCAAVVALFAAFWLRKRARGGVALTSGN